MADYMSFEDVMGELSLSEEELKRMVSEGELRAFRDENQMKFRLEDVKTLKKGKEAEPSGIMEGPGDVGSEATIIETDSDLAPPSADTAVPQLDFGEDSAPPTEEGETTGITDEMVFEDSDVAPHAAEEGEPAPVAEEASEAFVDEGAETGGAAEAVAEEAPAEEAAAAVEEEAPRPRRAGRAAAPPPPPSPGGHPIMTVCLFIAATVMALVGYFFVDLVRVMSSEEDSTPSSLSQGIRNAIAGKDDKTEKK